MLWRGLAGRRRDGNGIVDVDDAPALRRSLEQVPAIRQTLSDAETSLLQVLRESADELPDVRELIAHAISDDPPLALSDLGATALVALESELMVGTLDATVSDLGLSPFFVGLVLIPIIGNAAEHGSAVFFAAFHNARRRGALLQMGE